MDERFLEKATKRPLTQVTTLSPGQPTTAGAQTCNQQPDLATSLDRGKGHINLRRWGEGERRWASEGILQTFDIGGPPGPRRRLIEDPDS